MRLPACPQNEKFATFWPFKHRSHRVAQPNLQKVSQVPRLMADTDQLQL